jgi:predicted Fe-Mo cluster-binding NifX family protein
MQENEPMKICIPTMTELGKAALVSGHFGSAPYFTVYDTKAETVEVIGNSDQHHAHGMCHPMSLLADKDIDMVVCGGMGARAIQKLNEGGIRVFRAVPGTVGELLVQHRQGRLEEMTPADACRHHDCH